MIKAQRIVMAAQWTGANQAEILEALNTMTPIFGTVWTVEDDSTATLQLRETIPTGQWGVWTLQMDYWVVVAPDHGILDRLTDEKFRASYWDLGSA